MTSKTVVSLETVGGEEYAKGIRVTVIRLFAI